MSNGLITFIPAMMDVSCGTSALDCRLTPMQMVMADVKAMARNGVRCFPSMLRSTITRQSGMSLFATWTNVRDYFLQTCLSMIEISMLGSMCMIPLMMALPAMVVVTMGAICICSILALSVPLNGKQVLQSRMPADHPTDEFSDEHWIYVNGMMTR